MMKLLTRADFNKRIKAFFVPLYVRFFVTAVTEHTRAPLPQILITIRYHRSPLLDFSMVYTSQPLTVTGPNRYRVTVVPDTRHDIRVDLREERERIERG